MTIWHTTPSTILPGRTACQFSTYNIRHFQECLCWARFGYHLVRSAQYRSSNHHPQRSRFLAAYTPSNKQTFLRLQRGCGQLCYEHYVEQHPTSLLEQLESGFDQSRLLPMYRPSLIWQVGILVFSNSELCLKTFAISQE